MIRQLIAAKKKEFSQSTIRNIMARVRGMFFQAIEDGQAHQNPASRVGKLNKRRKDEMKTEINPLNREDSRPCSRRRRIEDTLTGIPYSYAHRGQASARASWYRSRVSTLISTGGSSSCNEISLARESAPPRTARPERSICPLNWPKC